MESALKLMHIFIRKLEFEDDETEISHVCCHRGRGIDADMRWNLWTGGPLKLPEDDIDEILLEESEFIEIFEERMRNLTSSSRLEDLQRTWMLQFKEHHEKHLAEVQDVEEEDQRRSSSLGNLVRSPPAIKREPTPYFHSRQMLRYVYFTSARVVHGGL